MKIISVFQNKGGVGKTTALFHTASALAEEGFKVLMMDLDPQSNLSLYGLENEELQKIWEAEDSIVENGFTYGVNTLNSDENTAELLREPRTIHFLMKPVESGVDDYVKLPPSKKISDNLYLIPGRITLSQFESVLAERWGNIDNTLSVRTVTQFRTIAKRYAEEYDFDYVLIDVSPSLGLLNRAILTTSDAFFMPANPDLFSMYGIRNIGKSLGYWNEDYKSIITKIKPTQKKLYPSQCVKFLGYTLYNSKRRSDQKLEMAKAHRNFAEQIPAETRKWIPSDNVTEKVDRVIEDSIGGTAIWYSHNTYPSLAQKYKCPIWKIPNMNLDVEDRGTVNANKEKYAKNREKYHKFAKDLLARL